MDLTAWDINFITEKALAFVKNLFRDDAGGHDYFHTLRVYKTALSLAEKEGGDILTISLAAVLHDADDIKLSPETAESNKNARELMDSLSIDKETQEKVITIIKQVSYKGRDSEAPDTLEGKIVQDADRLDAMGAVGIARAFAYGGSKGRPMYDPDILPGEDLSYEEYRRSGLTTYNHFHEKLLRLYPLMNTESAKAEALKRDKYMRDFLAEFMKEWEGDV